MWFRWRIVLTRFLLPALTGGMLIAGLPPFDGGQLAWVAFIPFLFAVRNCAPGEAFRRGYIAGLVFFGGTVWWIVHVTLPGMVGMIAVLALYFGLAGLWFARLLRHPPPGESFIRNVATAVVAAAGWVTLEWMREHFIFGGFGWNKLGVTQHTSVPLIQFADVTGVYGVSALVCLVNFVFFFTVRRFVAQVVDHAPLRRLSFEFYVGIFLVCAAFMYGMRQIQRRDSAERVRVSLVQGNIPQTLKWDPAEKPMILDRYATLTTNWALPYAPDLIIWPETATPEALRYDRESYSLVTNIVAQAGVPLLTGSTDYTPNSDPPEGFNAAMLVLPSGIIETVYRKTHLVPFGEYVPLEKLIPWMQKLTPIQSGFNQGTDYKIFELKSGLRFGVVICFEDTIASVYRKFIPHDVDFMVNLTNDGWFKQSSEAAIHLANAVFRAAETHRPLIRSTNHGITAVVDEYGFVQFEKEPFVEGVLNAEVALPVSRPLTFYVRHGDVFALGCSVVSAIAVLWQAMRARRPRQV